MNDHDDLGYRLAVIRNTCGLTQRDASDALGLSGQQAVSDIERRKTLADEEIQPFATLYNVTVQYVKTFKIEAMSRTVINIHDNQQAYGAHVQHNNVNPAEAAEKAKEENRQLYERLVESEKEKVAMQQQVIDTLKKLLDRFGGGENQ